MGIFIRNKMDTVTKTLAADQYQKNRLVNKNMHFELFVKKHSLKQYLKQEIFAVFKHYKNQIAPSTSLDHESLLNLNRNFEAKTY